MSYQSLRGVYLSPHFTIEEFVYSRTAIEHGILNLPSEAQIASIRSLVTHVLQPLRDRLGEPIAILSGFRNPVVNDLVGGVSTSQHTLGEAADCFIAQGPAHLLQVLRESRLPFDQAILYKRKKFLHISYREGRCRREVLER